MNDLATTFDWEKVMTKYFDPKATDNFFNASTFLEFMRKNAKKRNFGNTWRETLEMAEGIGGGYAELEVLDRSRKNIVHYADWDSGDYYTAMSISWKDQKRAKSPEEKVDLMKVRSGNAVKTMQRNLTTDMMYGDGTGTATASGAENEIVGLDTIIAEDNTTSAGGIDPAAYTWWVNQYTDVSGNVTLSDIINMNASCSDGNVSPDVIATDKFIKAFIWANLLQVQERYTTGKFNMAEELPMVIGIPIVTDAVFEASSSNGGEGGYGGGYTDGNMFFINKDALFLAINSQDDMKRWPMERPIDQFAYSTYWTHEQMLVCNNRRRLGRLFDITV